MSRPTRPRWADGNVSYVIEPGEGKKDVGWLLAEKPPFQYMNWIHKTTDDFLGFLDNKSENLVTTFLRSTGSASWNSGTGNLVLAQDLEIVFRIPGGEQINILEAGTYNLTDGDNLLFRKDAANPSPVTLVEASDYATLDDGQFFAVNNSDLDDAGFEFEEIVFRRDGTRLEIPLLGTSYANGDTFYFSDALANEVTTRTSEVLELNQKTTGGARFSNLGLSLAAGVLTICAADGSALSSTNKGFVWVNHPTIAGTTVEVEIAANVSIQDANNVGTKEILGNFGTITSQAIATSQPFFIGMALDTVSPDVYSFFITRDPTKKTTPSSSNNIGKSGTAPVTNSQTNIVLMNSSLTVADWVDAPCVILGGIRMTKSVTDSNGWTVQSLTNIDGFGEFYEGTTFTAPPSQGSSVSGKHTNSSMDFSSTSYSFRINKTGDVDFIFRLTGDGGSDGSGSTGLKMNLPLAAAAIGFDGTINGTFEIAGPSKNSISYAVLRSGSWDIDFAYQTTIGTANTSWLHSDFGNGTREIRGSGRYKAF